MRARSVSLLPKAAVIVAAVLLASSCSSSVADAPATSVQATASSEPTIADNSEQLFPDVIDVSATANDNNEWTFAVTLSSPYDSPSRYADSWRVRNIDGTVYGERFLTHDHASEQPFTRSQSGIEIPPEVLVVVVEGRDQVSGWGGTTIEFTLPR
jgi:hypothetical protein